MKTSLSHEEVREFLLLAKEHINLVLDNVTDPATHLHTSGVLIRHALAAVHEAQDAKAHDGMLREPVEVVKEDGKKDQPLSAKKQMYRVEVQRALHKALNSTTQQKLAKRLGVADSTVSRVTHKGEGSQAMFEKIGRKLGVEVWY